MTDAENQMPEGKWVGVHRITGRAGHLNSGRQPGIQAQDMPLELFRVRGPLLSTAPLAPLSVPQTVHIGTGLKRLVVKSTRVSLSKGQSLAWSAGESGEASGLAESTF